MQHYLCYPIPLLKAVEEPLHSASAFPNFQTDSRRAEFFIPLKSLLYERGVRKSGDSSHRAATRATAEHASAHPYPHRFYARNVVFDSCSRKRPFLFTLSACVFFFFLHPPVTLRPSSHVRLQQNKLEKLTS